MHKVNGFNVVFYMTCKFEVFQKYVQFCEIIANFINCCIYNDYYILKISIEFLYIYINRALSQIHVLLSVFFFVYQINHTQNTSVGRRRERQFVTIMELKAK